MEELLEIGFTKYEAMAFEALLKLGKASALSISRESGVPYGRIYSVLEAMEHKGLVKIIPEKGKKFVPGDPLHLKSLVQEKRRILDTIDKRLEELKKIYDAKEKEPVLIAKGKKNFYRLVREMPRPRKYEYTIKYTSEYNPEWVREYRENLKKGVELKDIVRVDDDTIKNIRKWLKIHKNIRKIDNDGIAVSVRDDSIVMMALIKSNALLLIRDAPLAKVMKILMKAYFQQAGSIS